MAEVKGAAFRIFTALVTGKIDDQEALRRSGVTIHSAGSRNGGSVQQPQAIVHPSSEHATGTKSKVA